MSLPHKISTLLYCFNAVDDVLMLQRTQEPNRGRWSPPGGKLKTDIGESPYACACREAFDCGAAAPELFLQCGLALALSGRSTDAEPLVRQALALRPDFTAAM